MAFQGSNVLGLGFTMTPDEAAGIIAREPRNAEALQPFVIGKDLNQRPDCSPSRWIINLRDWPLDRAKTYPDLIGRIRRLVKPQRDKLPDYKRRVRDNWWRYEHQAPTLYRRSSA